MGPVFSVCTQRYQVSGFVVRSVQPLSGLSLKALRHGKHTYSEEPYSHISLFKYTILPGGIMSCLSTERLEENYSCFFLNKTIGAYVLIYAECILSEFFFLPLKYIRLCYPSMRFLNSLSISLFQKGRSLFDMTWGKRQGRPGPVRQSIEA